MATLLLRMSGKFPDNVLLSKAVNDHGYHKLLPGIQVDIPDSGEEPDFPVVITVKEMDTPHFLSSLQIAANIREEVGLVLHSAQSKDLGDQQELGFVWNWFTDNCPGVTLELQTHVSLPEYSEE